MLLLLGVLVILVNYENYQKKQFQSSNCIAKWLVVNGSTIKVKD